MGDCQSNLVASVQTRTLVELDQNSPRGLAPARDYQILEALESRASSESLQAGSQRDEGRKASKGTEAATREDELQRQAQVSPLAAKRKVDMVLPVDMHPGLVALSSAGSPTWITKVNLFTGMCCDIEDASRLISSAAAGERLAGTSQLEGLIRELFRLHDLNSNGVLEEVELIKINKMICEIHYGPGNKAGAAVEAKYRTLFREHLDPDGQPVPYERFRDYILHLVRQYDKYEEAQAMIVEQWIAEAQTARMLGCGDPVHSLGAGHAQQKTASPSERQRLNNLAWPFHHCTGERPITFSVVRA